MRFHWMLIVAVLAHAVFAPAALAGWKGTQWGMSPDEVLAAMPGARLTDRGGQLDVGKALTVSEDTSYGFKAEVLYYYGDAGLELVGLEIPLKHCRDVVKLFLDERGVPLINKDQKIIRLLIWHDEATETRIRFVLGQGICGLNFERLATYRTHDLASAVPE